MQFYVGDYIQKTLHLTTEQNGAYLLLLFAMWQGNACLPNDQTKLARIARVSPKRWQSVWREIHVFFTFDGDVIRQDRLTKEFQKVLSISQERKTSGSLGGKAKALKNNVSDVAKANVLLEQKSGIPEPEPEEEKREAKASPKKRGSRLADDWFLPMTWGEWAIAEGFQMEAIRAEAENFKDYWHAKAGPTATKMDWKATWRIWMRKTSKSSQPRKNSNEQFGAAIHHLAGRLSDGTARIDLSNRDPFTVRPRGNPAPDELGAIPLFRSGAGPRDQG